MTTKKNSELKISKADLLWEIVRRNEDYKTDFAHEKKECKKGELKNGKIRRDFMSGGFQWQMFGMLDPSISAKEINAKIKEGKEPEDYHPYYHKFKPVVYHEIPGAVIHQVFSGHSSTSIGEYSHPYYKFEKNDFTISIDARKLENRIMLSIDLAENVDIILDAIKKIKISAANGLLRYINENNKWKKKRKKLYSKNDYSPSIDHLKEVDIASYMKWLKLYDDIRAKYIEKNKNGDANFKPTHKNGAIKITWGDWKTLVGERPANYKSDQNYVQYIREQFNNAKQLIQTAPNIIFAPSGQKGDPSKKKHPCTDICLSR